MTAPEPGTLPLSTETVCPFCDARVVVSLVAVTAAAVAEVTAVKLTPEYRAYHRCRIPYPVTDPDDPWHVPTPPDRP